LTTLSALSNTSAEDQLEAAPLMKEIRTFALAAWHSPNLDSIITFNFDDVLERCIDRVPVPAGYQVIDDDQIRPTAGLLAQHADHDRALQRAVLVHLEKAVTTSEAPGAPLE